MSKPTILFISHESSRTGAPLMLYQVIGWLKDNNICNPIILIAKKGILDEDFKKLGPVLFYHEKIDTRYKSFFFKAYGRFFNSSTGKWVREFQLSYQIRKYRPTLVYSNTIGNG